MMFGATRAPALCVAMRPVPRLARRRHLSSQPSAALLPEVKRKIVVLSGKGGVGKSTVAFELARRLAGRGRRVGIFDADVHGPSLPTQLGVDKRATPTADGWRMAPVEAGDMKLMSFGFIGELWDSEADIDPRGAGGRCFWMIMITKMNRI